MTARAVGVEFRNLGPGESPTVHVTMSDGSEQVWTSGEFPGKAAELGRIMGAPVRVKACGDCPFNQPDDRGDACGLDGNRYTPADGRPDWCPLELGPVTVEVERG